MRFTASLPTRLSRLLFGVLLGSAVILGAPAAALADAPCPPEPPAPLLHLRHLRDALRHETEAVVVAIGSSSTEGVMASDRAHSYPATLQADLERALPGMHIVVLNRGIGGQDAPEELARMRADAIAAHPQLVIWQVGANGALRNANPEVFHRMVTDGVTRLQEAGIDVILMDNQHSPRIDAAPEHGVLNAVLAEVAKETGSGLFSRAGLMATWAQEGAPSATFIATDGLHHNDRGYACVASALADAILDGLREPSSLSAHR